jgi:polyisoprenoid-binding protein YceI
MKKLLPIFLFFFALTESFSQDASGKEEITFTVDTVNSYIFWHCDSHYGTVPLKSGEVKVSGEDILEGQFVIKMDSIHDEDIDYDLMRKTLNNTLRSEFFFDVKNYPYSEFEIYYTEKKQDRYRIVGNLKIKGIVKCIEFPAKIDWSARSFDAVSDTFKINRLDWGIDIYSQAKAENDESVIISDSIDFVIHVKAMR